MKLFSLAVFGVLAASATDITTSNPSSTTTTTTSTTTSTMTFTTTTTPGTTTSTTAGTTTPFVTTTTSSADGSRQDEVIGGLWENLRLAFQNSQPQGRPNLENKWMINVIHKWHSRYYYLVNVGAAYGNSCVFDGRTFDMTISDTNNVCLVSEAYLLGITYLETCHPNKCVFPNS